MLKSFSDDLVKENCFCEEKTVFSFLDNIVIENIIQPNAILPSLKTVNVTIFESL